MVATEVTLVVMVRVGSVHPLGMGQKQVAMVRVALGWQAGLMVEMGGQVARQALSAKRPQEQGVEGDQHIMAGYHLEQVEVAMGLLGKKGFLVTLEAWTPMEVRVEVPMEIRISTSYTGVPVVAVEETMATTRRAQEGVEQAEASISIRRKSPTKGPLR